MSDPCTFCRVGRCTECVDVSRAFFGMRPNCSCARPGHKGEPHGAPEHVCDQICEMVNGRGNSV